MTTKALHYTLFDGVSAAIYLSDPAASSMLCKGSVKGRKGFTGVDEGAGCDGLSSGVAFISLLSTSKVSENGLADFFELFTKKAPCGAGPN